VAAAARASGATLDALSRPNVTAAITSIDVKLEVIANPRSLAASGSTSTHALRSRAPDLASAPSALHVTIKWCARARNCSQRSSVATLSGLLPERANDTTSVGTSRCSQRSGPATRSVVAMASTRRSRCRDSAGARQLPI
jgi:hypothetical protein